MIESLLVIIIACLVFFALLQYSSLLTAKLTMSHAAARAARARAVGFNRWMVEKSARTAAIPASGRRLVPEPQPLPDSFMGSWQRPGELWERVLHSRARSRGVAVELGRIPAYMESINVPTSEYLLDYELWDRMSIDIDEALVFDGTAPSSLRVTVRQYQPLLIALHALYEGELEDAAVAELGIQGSYTIEDHFPLYMEDMNW